MLQKESITSVMLSCIMIPSKMAVVRTDRFAWDNGITVDITQSLWYGKRASLLLMLSMALRTVIRYSAMVRRFEVQTGYTDRQRDRWTAAR